MAYLPANQLDKDEEKNQGAVNQDGGQTAPTLSAPGAMAPTNASAAAKAKPTASGSFTNLNNYISANKGNDTQMGSQVESRVGGQAAVADTSGDALHDGASTEVESGTVRLDEGELKTFKGETPAPIDGTLRPTVNKDIYGQQINAEYGGPTSATDGTLAPLHADANKNYTAVQDSANLAAGGLEGRGTLLKDAYGQEKYTQGQNQLDSFILGAGVGGQQSLKDIEAKYGGYGNKFTNLVDIIEGKGGMIDTGKEITDATKTTWRDETTNQLGLNDAEIKKAEEAAGKVNKTKTEELDELKAGLDNPKTQVSTLVGLGMSPEAAATTIAAAKGDPKQLMSIATANGLMGTGDYLSDQDRDRHGELGALLELINGDEEFEGLHDQNRDLTATGSDEGSMSVNTAAMDAAQTLTDMKTSYDTLSSSFTSGKATPAQLKELGVEPYLYERAKIRGVDLKQFLKPGPALLNPNIAKMVDATKLPAYIFDQEAFEPAVAAAEGDFNFGQGTDVAATSVETTPEEKAALVEYTKQTQALDTQIAGLTANLADPKTSFIERTNIKHALEALKAKRAGMKPPARSSGPGKKNPGASGDFMTDATNLLNNVF